MRLEEGLKKGSKAGGFEKKKNVAVRKNRGKNGRNEKECELEG